MDRKIHLDGVVAASKRTRQFLCVGGMNFLYSHHGMYVLYVSCNSAMGIFLLGYSLYHYRHSIEKLAVVVHHVTLMLDVFATVHMGYAWENETNILLSEPYWSYNYQSPLMLEKLNQIKKQGAENLRVMFKYLKYSVMFTFFDINALAAFEGYLLGDSKQTLFPCWFPFELDNYLVYLAVMLWQETMVVHMIAMIFGALAITHYIYSHVKTELDLLTFAIDNIEERVYEMAGGKREEAMNPDLLKGCYIRCTRMCAQHHSNIIRYFNSGPNTIETIYSLVFISGLVVCTSTGFALISDNMALKVKFIGITIIELIYLYSICWFPEAVAKVSLEVSDTIFLMDWYKLPKECRSIMMVMLCRSNKPLHMKLTTGSNVDLEGCMALIKASYSYFNMMLATVQ